MHEPAWNSYLYQDVEYTRLHVEKFFFRDEPAAYENLQLVEGQQERLVSSPRRQALASPVWTKSRLFGLDSLPSASFPVP